MHTEGEKGPGERQTDRRDTVGLTGRHIVRQTERQTRTDREGHTDRHRGTDRQTRRDRQADI